MGLSRDGLARRARTYLAELLMAYGGVAGSATLQAHLGEPHLDDTEALLIGKGLLRRTRSGRELTRDGRRRAAGIVTGSRRYLGMRVMTGVAPDTLPALTALPTHAEAPVSLPAHATECRFCCGTSPRSRRHRSSGGRRAAVRLRLASERGPAHQTAAKDAASGAP